MVPLGTRTRSREPLRLFIAVWYLANVARGLPEAVEIVTPANARPTTAEVPPPRNASRGPPLAPAGPAAPAAPAATAATDSYLRAYREVHKLRSGPVKRQDGAQEPPEAGGDAYDTVIRSSYLGDGYPSLTHSQWPPQSPPPAYGPPHSSGYRVEVPPSRPCHQIPYSASAGGFLPKKLSVKLLLKVLLKLVLFKMIVKFVAVLCLLLFLPLLKSKETPDHEGDDRRRARQLEAVSDLVWSSIEEKNALFDEEAEMKDIKDIADQTEEDNHFAGPERAVRFLEFCVSTVNSAVSYLLSYLKRQRNESDDLALFIWDKFHNMVQAL